MNQEREFVDIDEAIKLSKLSRMTVWRIVNSIYTSNHESDINDVKKIEADNPKGWKLTIAKDRLEKELNERAEKQRDKQQDLIKSDIADTIPDIKMKKEIQGDSDIKTNGVDKTINTLINQNERMLNMIQRQLEQKDRRIGELEQNFLTIQNNFIKMLEGGRGRSKEQTIESETEPATEERKSEAAETEQMSEQEPQRPEAPEVVYGQAPPDQSTKERPQESEQGSQPQHQQPPQQASIQNQTKQTQTKKKGIMAKLFG